MSGQTRTGKLVRLETTGGSVGWGDVAPLPGFSRDSVEEVDSTWPRHRAALLDRRWITLDPERLDTLDAPLGGIELPSLRFGLEQALIGLTANVHACHPAEVFAPGRKGPVRLAGLVTETGERALENAVKLKNRGFLAIKIKVGRKDVGRDAETVLAIRAHIGENVELRLDANRAWTLDQAVEFLAATSEAYPAFIEEPLADPRAARKRWQSTGASIALDETLVEIAPSELGHWAFASHIVLKPTLLGGIIASEAFVTAGRRLGIEPVVSASYESGIGISALICLAARWCPNGPAAGLDTYSRLETDVLEQRLSMGPETNPVDLTFEPGRSISENP